MSQKLTMYATMVEPPAMIKASSWKVKSPATFSTDPTIVTESHLISTLCSAGRRKLGATPLGAAVRLSAAKLVFGGFLVYTYCECSPKWSYMLCSKSPTPYCRAQCLFKGYILYRKDGAVAIAMQTGSADRCLCCCRRSFVIGRLLFLRLGCGCGNFSAPRHSFRIYSLSIRTWDSHIPCAYQYSWQSSGRVVDRAVGRRRAFGCDPDPRIPETASQSITNRLTGLMGCLIARSLRGVRQTAR